MLIVALLVVVCFCVGSLLLIRKRHLQDEKDEEEEAFDRAETEKLSGKEYPLPLRMASILRDRALGLNRED